MKDKERYTDKMLYIYGGTYTYILLFLLLLLLLLLIVSSVLGLLARILIWNYLSYS
jgi:hypothetical protein